MKLADIDWDTWQARDRATLLFVIRDGQVLLIHKKRGLGKGKVNGPGGRVESLEALISETAHPLPFFGRLPGCREH